MAAFYDGKYDILLSTAIVESGLDIPTANTLIVHRADMFGLAQLYQLRGRVGRSKTRAYALFTVPPNRTLTPQAEKRLKVLQSLDTLGAGFQLASHDLDIRGAGNLLGEEQSGHIKEVGYELYQQMLRRGGRGAEGGHGRAGGRGVVAVDHASARRSRSRKIMSPISTLRLGLYRRLVDARGGRRDRGFRGRDDRPLRSRCRARSSNCLKLIAIKALCRKANVEKLEAGPKGITLGFRDNSFANPQGLVRFVAEQGSGAKVRPDMRVVFIRDFEDLAARLEGTRVILRTLAAIATKKAA